MNEGFVILNVGRTKFTVSLHVLRMKKGTIFYKQILRKEISAGKEVFYDKDPLYFPYILNFLRTGVLEVGKLSDEEKQLNKNHLCASFQEAIVDVLLNKLQKAAVRYNCHKIIITGGVSANSRLRIKAEALAKKNNYTLVIPPLRYCTDNAAMIGYTGLLHLQNGEAADLGLGPMAQSKPEDFIYDLQ